MARQVIEVIGMANVNIKIPFKPSGKKELKSNYLIMFWQIAKSPE